MPPPLNVLFLLLTIAVALTFRSSPGLCLIVGLVASLSPLQRVAGAARPIGKRLMAWAIVGLGATIQIQTVYSLSVEHLALTIISITGTMVIGVLVGRALSLPPVLAVLISSGTAICGASAIAAVGGAIKARDEDLSIALGVILLFNTVALFLFPWIGHALALPSGVFAAWAGLAIHDTSSVIGATLAFDPTIVESATTIKLARAVWIAPLTLL